MQSQLRGKWLLFAVLALPAAELLTFIAASFLVGFGPAFLAVVAISLLGVLLFRQQRVETTPGIRLMMDGQRLSSVDLSEAGLHRWISAILLIVPGFITGLFGGLLLIAPIRRRLAARLKRYFAPESAPEPGIVDLPEADWRIVPEERIEHRREP